MSQEITELDDLDPLDTHESRRWVFDCLTQSEYATEFLRRHPSSNGYFLPNARRYAQVLPAGVKPEHMARDRELREKKQERQKALVAAKENKAMDMNEKPVDVPEPKARPKCGCGRDFKNIHGLTTHQRSCPTHLNED